MYKLNLELGFFYLHVIKDTGVSTNIPATNGQIHAASLAAILSRD